MIDCALVLVDVGLQSLWGISPQLGPLVEHILLGGWPLITQVVQQLDGLGLDKSYRIVRDGDIHSEKGNFHFYISLRGLGAYLERLGLAGVVSFGYYIVVGCGTHDFGFAGHSLAIWCDDVFLHDLPKHLEHHR